MEENEGAIKLGRINRACEKALGLSLVSDVNVYMGSLELDQLAASRPNDYLQTIEEIGTIIKKPDYIRYDENKDEFIFLREYIQNGSFVKVAVRLSHIGCPKKWQFKKMHCLGLDEAHALNISHLFVRVNN